MKRLLLPLLLLLATFLAANELGYTKETRGLVRNLLVYKYPAWVAKIELGDGKELYFSSPKSMFEFYLHPGRWHDLHVKSENDFKKLLVTDYVSTKPINARGAFFVYGSNVVSPAGDDLVAFDSYSDAEQFAKKHNGKRILGFSQINLALINLLNGRI